MARNVREFERKAMKLICLSFSVCANGCCRGPLYSDTKIDTSIL